MEQPIFSAIYLSVQLDHPSPFGRVQLDQWRTERHGAARAAAARHATQRWTRRRAWDAVAGQRQDNMR
jgi:hypothetical protein